MRKSKKLLGITDDDLLVSNTVNSRLVAIEYTENLTYPDQQIVPRICEGHITGSSFDKLKHEFKTTTEGLSKLFDGAKADLNGKQGSISNQDFLKYVSGEMIFTKKEISCKINWHDQNDIRQSKYESCSFKRVSQIAVEALTLFDFNKANQTKGAEQQQKRNNDE